MNLADKQASNTHSTPPRAPLAFRVGVVGHRPDRLDNSKLDEMAATIRTILSIVKAETHAVADQLTEFYDDARPILRAISPLAEGTDRILAEQALSLGFELCAVLPFPQSEFEKDFAQSHALEDKSLSRFRGLLAQATTRFELDGTRAEEAAAYGRGGLVVLNQSDLLIVVWDGERQGKRGGTEESFGEERSRGVTVVWIDALEPRNWQLLDAATPLPVVAAGQRVVPDGSGSAVGLAILVREVLELPKLAEAPKKESHETREPHDKRIDARTGLKLFYAEHRPTRTLAVFWKLFVQTIGDGKWPKVRFILDDFEEAVMEDWPLGPLDPDRGPGRSVASVLCLARQAGRALCRPLSQCVHAQLLARRSRGWTGSIAWCTGPDPTRMARDRLHCAGTGDDFRHHLPRTVGSDPTLA